MCNKGEELYLCIVKFFLLFGFEYFTVDAVLLFQFGFFVVIPKYDQEAYGQEINKICPSGSPERRCYRNSESRLVILPNPAAVGRFYPENIISG